MAVKEWLGALGVVLTLVAYVPYIAAILRGTIKPHVFSWLIWGAGTLLVFFAQLADGGGAGAWPVGMSGITTLIVAALAYAHRGDNSITRADWCFLGLSTLALPAWVITSDPLWAAVILSVADLLGFGPTFRKAYHHPYDEQLSFYVILIGRNILAVAALEHYSVTTVIFPATVAISCVFFVTLVVLRRRNLPVRA